MTPYAQIVIVIQNVYSNYHEQNWREVWEQFAKVRIPAIILIL